MCTLFLKTLRYFTIKKSNNTRNFLAAGIHFHVKLRFFCKCFLYFLLFDVYFTVLQIWTKMDIKTAQFCKIKVLTLYVKHLLTNNSTFLTKIATLGH